MPRIRITDYHSATTSGVNSLAFSGRGVDVAIVDLISKENRGEIRATGTITVLDGNADRKADSCIEIPFNPNPWDSEKFPSLLTQNQWERRLAGIDYVLRHFLREEFVIPRSIPETALALVRFWTNNSPLLSAE